MDEVPIVDTGPKRNMQSTLLSMKLMSVTELSGDKRTATVSSRKELEKSAWNHEMCQIWERLRPINRSSLTKSEPLAKR
ncbi:hypothetical protein TorRG33x02_232380 [Trema orientale]|uniref:Uncharacterized protein n=1 Tax=Trema orientale TaxID=63057 RepID=A0A2P5E625_TREOI|nr:hypothetical protein TorRG33x02_232380 [Trema orientale]